MARVLCVMCNVRVASLVGQIFTRCSVSSKHILYSRKYWRSLDLVVLPQTTLFTLLVDLNVAVWYVFHTIGGFKCGGMVRYCHTYMHAEKKISRF